MLDNIAQKYELPDRGKALRCILDYIAKDANWNEIFSVTRCCGVGVDLVGLKTSRKLLEGCNCTAKPASS